MGAAAFVVANWLGGTIGVIVVFGLAIVMAVAFWLASRRTPVGADNVNDEWTGTVAPRRESVPASV